MIRISDFEVRSESGKALLSPINLEVQKSAVLGLYGPNGSGKSSLLRGISGVLRCAYQKGEVFIDGIPISLLSAPSDRVKRILYLGSDFKSPFDLTVRDLFELGMESASGRLWPGINPKERDQISSVVETLNLVPFLPRIFQTLSDGEKQIIMFARALIQAPRVLVLDETFSKLDLDRLIAVTRIIRSWARDGFTFLISSHDLNFLSEVSDQLVFIKKGEVLAEGSVDAVLTEAHLQELFTEISPHVVVSPQSGKRKILY